MLAPPDKTGMQSGKGRLLEEYRALAGRLTGLPLVDWASGFAATDRDPWLDGSFGFRRGGGDWDLYGLVDMLLCAVTLHPVRPLAARMDLQRWADRIRSCLDERGLATIRNPTEHGLEHATAYAYSGLLLLKARGARVEVPRFGYFRSSQFSEAEFSAWFDRMGLEFPRWTPELGLVGSLRRAARRLGWYRFWSGSHVVGGILATAIMRHQLESPDGRVPGVDELPELQAFFTHAGRRIDRRTGFWRPWTKRALTGHADVADLGGAAHFLWLYDRIGVRHPCCETMVRQALDLQRPDGLLLERPGCIDLDFTHLLSYAARIGACPDLDEVDRAMLRSGIAVLRPLLEPGHLASHRDSHGLPGRLCSVAQVDAYLRWRSLETGPSPTANVLSEACWI